MKNFPRLQKVIIAGILVLPVFIGTLMLLSQNRAGHGAGRVPISFKKIGLVQIRGTIVESEEWVRQLRALRLDNSIGGVVVRIESPGGAVAPSQEIYAEIMRYRASGKPLAVSMGSVAASGGYYIGCAAQKIFADPGTLTGSIGVIFSAPLFAELSKKIGVEFRVLKAGALKDAGSPFRPMTEQEKQYLQTLLRETHEQFIGDVAKARNMPRDSVLKFADGRVMTGSQAFKARLIDTLGGYQDALDWLRVRTGVAAGSRIIQKKPASSRLRDWFDEESSRIFPFLQSIRRPAGLYYLMEYK